MLRVLPNAVPALLAALLACTALAAAAPSALDILTQSHQEAARSQARIDKLDDDMRRMRDEMRRGVLQLESLKTELPPLRQQAQSLAAQRAQLERELAAGVAGQLDVPMAMSRTLDWLDAFVAADLPFLLERRRERIAGLRALAAKPDVPDSDKLRALLEVVQVELQYGRSVEASGGTLKFGGAERPVEFLRVGRVMLYYLDPATERQGYWDPDSRGWRALGAAERERLQAALRMARGEAPTELMELPLPAAPRT